MGWFRGNFLEAAVISAVNLCAKFMLLTQKSIGCRVWGMCDRMEAVLLGTKTYCLG